MTLIVIRNFFRTPLLLSIIVATTLLFSVAQASAAPKYIVARQDNSAPPSLLSFCLLLLQQPDYIELPLVLTKDDIPVVFNDLCLRQNTNVTDFYPGRSRDDGNYYIVDFYWRELQNIMILSDTDTERSSAHFFSLEDAATLLQKASGVQQNAPQLVPTILFPRFYRKEGKDISSIIIKKALAGLGEGTRTLTIQCCDPEEVERIHTTLLTGLPVNISLWQGIAESRGIEPYSYDILFTQAGIRQLSMSANALLLTHPEKVVEQNLQRLITNMHALNMNVFVGLDLPNGTLQSPTLEKYLFSLNADGLYTTSPTSGKKLLQKFNENNTLTEPQQPEASEYMSPGSAL